MSILLLPLDYQRMKSGEFHTHDTYRYLFYFHLFGLLFIVPAWSMTFRKEWVNSTRLRRGIHIWGMVLMDFIFLFGMAIVVFLDRDGLIIYMAFLFISGWMFSMSHRERLIFNLATLPVMFVIIILKDEVSYSKIAMFYEITFLSIIAFFFDAFDYNLNVSNFLARKTIEKERERIKDLERFKSKFFTNLTHELRTPLTVISGMASVIAENPKRWVAEGTEMINRNAGNLLNVINQILDLSKLEDGSLSLNMVRSDIVSYLGYIVDAFRGHSESKKISLHYLSNEAVLEMDYDSDKIFSIMSNLISNAIRYTPEGGDIYVQLSFIDSAQKPMIEITVRDTGTGIAEKDLDKIFDRFYQAEDSQKHFGSGIGLSIVHELVRLFEGDIKVKSTKGKGTQFIITLPVRGNADSVNPALFRPKMIKEASHYIHHPELAKDYMDVESDVDLPEVLIVEDNEDVITFLRITLGDKYQLTVRNDGQSGIDKALEMVPDLILCDVMMPIKDGYTLCRELKSNDATSHIPIILLSSKSDTPSRIIGLEAGADLYMVKPFDRKEMQLQLDQMIESRRELQIRYRDLTRDVKEIDATREDEFVRRVKEIIYQHLDDSEFGILQLCRAIFLSRTQLHKKLKALTGLSAPSLSVRSGSLQQGIC